MNMNTTRIVTQIGPGADVHIKDVIETDDGEWIRRVRRYDRGAWSVESESISREEAADLIQMAIEISGRAVPPERIMAHFWMYKIPDAPET